MTSTPRAKHYSKPYSYTSLKRLRSVAPDIIDAQIKLERNDKIQSARYQGTVRREGGKNGVARLILPALRQIERSSDSREIAFMRDFADRYSPFFGHVSRSAGPLAGDTELEYALNLNFWDPANSWDRYLRGYSWITVVPASLARRVGGAGGLRATGAFAAVEEVAGGSVWLLAADRWQDFSEDQTVIDRVFEALAPILPLGMPDRGMRNLLSTGFPPRSLPGYTPYLLSIRDAAEFQSSVP